MVDRADAGSAVGCGTQEGQSQMQVQEVTRDKQESDLEKQACELYKSKVLGSVQSLLLSVELRCRL